MLYHDGYDDFQNLDVVVRTVVNDLKEHLSEFDAIVVTGISGQCVGFPVALRLKKAILCLRKQDETTHGVPGQLLGKRHMKKGTRVLFLDDFLGVGRTMRLCREAAENAGGVFVAAYWYRDYNYLAYA